MRAVPSSSLWKWPAIHSVEPAGRPQHVWALWCCAACVSLAGGMAASPDQLLAALAAAVALTLAAVATMPFVQRPVVGLRLLVVAGVLVPLPFRVGATSANVCVLLAFAVVAGWSLRRLLIGGIRFERTALTYAVLALAATSIVSFLAGQAPWFDGAETAPMRAQLGGLALYLLSAGLTLVAGEALSGADSLRSLTFLFLTAAGIAVAAAIAAALPGLSLLAQIVRVESLGSAFWTWTAALALGQALFNRELGTRVRAACLLLASAVLIRGLVVAFSWASGWLPPLVAMGTLLALRFPRGSLIGALLGVAPAAYVGQSVISAVLAGESYSWLTRTQALDVMWQLIQRSPWVGLGPANYYFYARQFSLLGWYVTFSSHNQYVDLLAQTGLAGLGAFVAIAVSAVLLIRNLRARYARSGFEAAYLAGVLGGLTGSLASGLLADWLIPFAYNIGLTGFRSSLLFWLFLGGLLSLQRHDPVRTP